MNSNLHASSMSPQRLRLMFHPLSVLKLRFCILFLKGTTRQSKAAKQQRQLIGQMGPRQRFGQSPAEDSTDLFWTQKAQERRPYACLIKLGFHCNEAASMDRAEPYLCNIFRVCIVGTYMCMYIYIYNMHSFYIRESMYFSPPCCACSSGKRQKNIACPQEEEQSTKIKQQISCCMWRERYSKHNVRLLHASSHVLAHILYYWNSRPWRDRGQIHPRRDCRLPLCLPVSYSSQSPAVCKLASGKTDKVQLSQRELAQWHQTESVYRNCIEFTKMYAL